jgi:hypothetical protein
MASERQQKSNVPAPFLNPIGFWQNYLINYIEASRGKSEITSGLMKISQASSNTKSTDLKSSSSTLSNSTSQSKPANIITQESNSSKPNSSADYMTGVKAGRIDGSVGVRDAGAACADLNGTRLNQCIQGYNTAFNAVCKTTKFGWSG